MTSSSAPLVLALLAQPVSGNPMQYMIEKVFAHHNLDWRYLTFEVFPENIGDAIRGLKALGFCGGHIGDPHKQAALTLLDRCTENALSIGAVNFFSRDGDALLGDNIEGKGVLSALQEKTSLQGKHVVLLGAGRLGRATAWELAAAGVGAINLLNRSEDRAAELAALLTSKFPVDVTVLSLQDKFALPAEAEVFINATAQSEQLSDDALPLLPDSLRAEVLVADASPVTPQTPLLRMAAQRGCITVDGLSILIAHVRVAVRLWTGVDPCRDVLRDALEEYLEV
ncbi:MAG: shikimate dehydrogenase family protein [Thermoguttaceae bacterium]